MSDPSDHPGSAPEPARRMRLTGLHHVTAICADLDRTTAFYRDVLGLALLREGRNDDDPDARHFWFGHPGDGGVLVSFMAPIVASRSFLVDVHLLGPRD